MGKIGVYIRLRGDYLMEYLELSKGHLLTIMIPIAYFYIKLINYQNSMFYKSYVKTIIIISATFAIISTPIFYFYGFGPYFCFIWGTGFALLPSSVAFGVNIANKYVNSEKEDYKRLGRYDKFFFLCSFVLGCFFMVIPYISIYNVIGGDNNNTKVMIVSRIIFILNYS